MGLGERRTAVLVLLSLTLLFGAGLTTAEAQTEHEVRIDGDTAEVTTTVQLHSPEPGEGVNFWDVSMGVTEGAEVTSIEDTQGKIEDYTVKGNEVSFKTNTGVGRETETVEVSYVVEGILVNELNGLRTVEVRISSLEGVREDVPDGKARATVTAEDEIQSASPVRGFTTGMTGDELRYEGEASTTVRLTVGEPDERYENYAVFADGTGEEAGFDLTEPDAKYGLVRSGLGFEPAVNRHPIVVLDDERYDAEVNGWSEGQHRTGGLIALRRSVFEDDPTTTVLHETVHAYNSDALKWSGAPVGWFDEGTAQYIEFLADRERGEVRPSLFGEERVATDGDGRYTILSARGETGRLWGYYTDGEDFMRTWKPDGSEEFGYAFSELVVRNYVNRNGAGSLHELYDELLKTEKHLKDSEQATRLIHGVMGSVGQDMNYLRPCSSRTRGAFEDCLEGVNRMDAVVPAYRGGTGERYGFEPVETERKVREENRTDRKNSSQQKDERGGILGSIVGFLRSILEAVRGVFSSAYPAALHIPVT